MSSSVMTRPLFVSTARACASPSRSQTIGAGLSVGVILDRGNPRRSEEPRGLRLLPLRDRPGSFRG